MVNRSKQKEMKMLYAVAMRFANRLLDKVCTDEYTYAVL